MTVTDHEAGVFLSLTLSVASAMYGGLVALVVVYRWPLRRIVALSLAYLVTSVVAFLVAKLLAWVF